FRSVLVAPARAKATAAAFARAGATVCLGDVDTAAARAAAAEIGPNARGLQLDVASKASFARFLAAAERRAGPPTVLVNNAGVMPLGRFLDESDETSRRT